MIDTHCHILPGLDDGSSSLQMSMIMAAMAADDGITDIIATPHVMWDRSYTIDQLSAAIQALDILRAAIDRSCIPVNCHLGAEILCVEPALELLRKGLFPCIKGTKFALVEFFFDDSVENMTSCLRAIQGAGINPVVAHPERYNAIQNHKDLAERWVKMGILLQINTGSIYGQLGKRVKKAAVRILDDGLASLVATDAHDIRSRPLQMSAARSWLVQHYGETRAHLLTEVNPLHLLNNQPLNKISQQITTK